jgi:hypothetical protein
MRIRGPASASLISLGIARGVPRALSIGNASNACKKNPAMNLFNPGMSPC